MGAKEWIEKTPGLGGDLGGKKIFGAKTTLISEEICGIQRMKAQETRSKLRIEGRWQQNKTHLGKISFLKFADNYASLRYGQDRYPKNTVGDSWFGIRTRGRSAWVEGSGR